MRAPGADKIVSRNTTSIPRGGLRAPEATLNFLGTTTFLEMAIKPMGTFRGLRINRNPKAKTCIPRAERAGIRNVTVLLMVMVER